MACLVVLAGCRSLPDLSDRVGLFEVVDGNEQILQAGATAATPLAVRALNEPGLPMRGLEVRWSIASGGGRLSTSSSMTDNSGRATVSYTAPAQPGPVVVRATAPPEFSVAFSLTVVAAPGS